MLRNRPATNPNSLGGNPTGCDEDAEVCVASPFVNYPMSGGRCAVCRVGVPVTGKPPETTEPGTS